MLECCCRSRTYTRPGSSLSALRLFNVVRTRKDRLTRERTDEAPRGTEGEARDVVVPIDPTSAGFLFAENRQMPMHVGGLQLLAKPEGAPRDYARKIYQSMSEVNEI